MKASVVQLALLSGSSPQRGFSLGHGKGRALFRIGSAPECNWRICGPGIAPHHLMILWSGRVLSIVDVGAGNLFVNGESFHHSCELVNGRIQFGSGKIAVRTRIDLAA